MEQSLSAASPLAPSTLNAFAGVGRGLVDEWRGESMLPPKNDYRRLPTTTTTDIRILLELALLPFLGDLTGLTGSEA